MTKNINGNNFIEPAAGNGAASMSTHSSSSQIPADIVVPKRVFGNTGVKISKLCLGGGSFPVADSQALLDEALCYGVDCWEIVSFLSQNVYRDYFKTHPEIREKIFLTGKILSTDPVVMQEQLDATLRENGTSYIDFLAIHSIDNIGALTDDVRKWVEKVKKNKTIRFFGFCTHKNMDACLRGAAELGWIDGIQTVYSYRFQGIKSMEEAMQRCHEKGIGIFNVKSMGLTVRKRDELQRLLLHEENLNALPAAHGMSFEQAKLKAIWENNSVTSVCSLMPDSRILQANASAAMDERPLTPEIRKLLAQYSEITGQYFCRRCGLCDTANTDSIPIFNIMEMLMYCKGYTEREKNMIVKKFEQIPIEIRNRISTSDYSDAEKICPQKMPIARLMKDAFVEFGG